MSSTIIKEPDWSTFPAVPGCLHTYNPAEGTWEVYYSSTMNAQFGVENATYWPRVLNHPASGLFPVDALESLAQKNPDPESWTNFKQHIQSYQLAGKDKIELVSREALETAKRSLHDVTAELDEVQDKAYEVLKSTAFINGIGAVLIILGTIGVYFSQRAKPAELHGPVYQGQVIRALSYASVITGLALVIFSTYRLGASANAFN